MLRKVKKPNRVPDYVPPRPPCRNCGEPGAHFVPPSFGEDGFFMCDIDSTPTRGPQ